MLSFPSLLCPYDLVHDHSKVTRFFCVSFLLFSFFLNEEAYVDFERVIC